MDDNNVKYDTDIIQVFANKLYKDANTIIQNYIFTWGCLSSIPAGLIYASTKSGMGTLIIFVFSASLFGYVGYYIGKEKAMKLKLEAQVALCQAQIEKNTRSG